VPELGGGVDAIKTADGGIAILMVDALTAELPEP
jgi:hypothetical protein